MLAPGRQTVSGKHTVYLTILSLAYCQASTLASHEIQTSHGNEAAETMGQAASEPPRVRIVTNTNPVISGLLDDGAPSRNSAPGLIDRLSYKLMDSLQSDRLKELQDSFIERLENIRSARSVSDKVYKLKIDLPISAKNGHQARFAEAPDPHVQQVGLTDINQLVHYDDSLHDEQSTMRRYYSTRPAQLDNGDEFVQASAYGPRFEHLATNLAESLFGYYPARSHRVVRSIDQQQQNMQKLQQAPQDIIGAYHPMGSSPMVAHVESPGGPLVQETANPLTKQSNPLDSLSSDSIWLDPAGEPATAHFDASASGFGQRSSSGVSSMQQQQRQQRPVMRLQPSSMVSDFLQDHSNIPGPSPMDAKEMEQQRPADQIRLASSEEYSDQFAMKSDEEDCDENDQVDHQYRTKPAKKASSRYSDKEESSHEPPKKVIVKKEEKHHHYHHHHHHHEPQKKGESYKKVAEKAALLPQTQPLHLEIHIKGKSKAKSKSKAKGKGKDKDKSKAKDGDEIYVKLNQGVPAPSSSPSEGYGGGDDGSYVEGKSTNHQLLEDKKSLVNDAQDDGYGGADDGATGKPGRHASVEAEVAETPKRHEDQAEEKSSDAGEQQEQQEQQSGESKSTENVDSGRQEGDAADVINTSQVPSYTFDTYNEEHRQPEKHDEAEKGAEKGNEGEGEANEGGSGEENAVGNGAEGGQSQESSQGQQASSAADSQGGEEQTLQGQPREESHQHKHLKKHEKKEKKHKKSVLEHKPKMKNKEEKKPVVDVEKKKEQEVVKHQEHQEHHQEHKKEHHQEHHEQAKPVEQPPVVQKEEEGVKEKQHKSKHAHIEVHKHNHFEHHEHINLPQQQPHHEHEEHQPEQHHDEHLGEHGGLGHHEGVQHHEGAIELGAPVHQDHVPEHHFDEGMHHHHQPQHHEMHDEPMMHHQHHKPEHHQPIKEHWSEAHHEKPAHHQESHGPIVIEDHSLLEKHNYEHPEAVHYGEQVINHPHGFGLTPVAAYNLMGAYSTQSSSHSSGSEKEAKSNKKHSNARQSNKSDKKPAVEKPTRQ